jgi:hypothetical protein
MLNKSLKRDSSDEEIFCGPVNVSQSARIEEDDRCSSNSEETGAEKVKNLFFLNWKKKTLANKFGHTSRRKF